MSVLHKSEVADAKKKECREKLLLLGMKSICDNSSKKNPKYKFPIHSYRVGITVYLNSLLRLHVHIINGTGI